jgi:hypothetical protein
MKRRKITLIGIIVVVCLTLFSTQGSAYMPLMGDMDCQNLVDCHSCSVPVLPSAVVTNQPSYTFRALQAYSTFLPLEQADSPYHPPR